MFFCTCTTSLETYSHFDAVVWTIALLLVTFLIPIILDRLMTVMHRRFSSANHS